MVLVFLNSHTWRTVILWFLTDLLADLVYFWSFSVLLEINLRRYLLPPPLQWMLNPSSSYLRCLPSLWLASAAEPGGFTKLKVRSKINWAYHGVRIKETWADLCKIRRDPNRQLHELQFPASVSKRVQVELDNIPLHPLRDATRYPCYVCPFDLGDLSRDNWVGGWGLGLGVEGEGGLALVRGATQPPAHTHPTQPHQALSHPTGPHTHSVGNPSHSVTPPTTCNSPKAASSPQPFIFSGR